jgi:hypothetical protein
MEKVIIVPFEKCCDDSKSRQNVLDRQQFAMLLGDLPVLLADNYLAKTFLV